MELEGIRWVPCDDPRLDHGSEDEAGATSDSGIYDHHVGLLPLVDVE